MKPGGSGLNPNAAAYVPLYKREADSSKPAAAATTHQVQHHQPYGYGVQGKGSSPGAHMRDDYSEIDMEMEMEYLLSSFSGLSDESIRDVYLANDGDLDATVEMLTQLEIYSNEAEEYLPLPDTLDIGDVPEAIEPSVPKQKSASNEASASSSSTSSGTPNNAPVSSS